MPKNDNLWRSFGRYYGLAFLLPTCVFVGYLIGWLLDQAFGTKWLKIVFLLLGVASGMIELVRELNKPDGGD